MNSLVSLPTSLIANSTKEQLTRKKITCKLSYGCIPMPIDNDRSNSLGLAYKGFFSPFIFFNTDQLTYTNMYKAQKEKKNKLSCIILSVILFSCMFSRYTRRWQLFISGCRPWLLSHKREANS